MAKIPKRMNSARKPLLEVVNIISSKSCNQFTQQEKGNAGVAGHGSDVTALSVPRSAQAIKKPAIADGVELCEDLA